MSNEKSKIDHLLRTVYKLFPEAEVLNRDGSWEKLSSMFEMTADVKKRPANSRQLLLDQQLTLDFGVSSKGNNGGAHV